MGGSPSVPTPPPTPPAPPPEEPIDSAIFEPTADGAEDKERKLKAIKLGKKRLQVPVSAGESSGINTA